jgi:dTDP-4-dehydrorhamnose 3,5-epimerase
MDFERTRIPDVVLVRPEVFRDGRGFFLESWQERVYASAGLDARFVQDNHSRSVRYTLRGLHYQIARPQGKLVRVATGKVFDVAVDLRRSSPTFGHWVGVVLDGVDHHALWVPPGFAHGFLVLSESADFLYKCTDFYVPSDERSIRWDDPQLAIDWPLPPGERPHLSSRDASAVRFSDAEYFP